MFKINKDSTLYDSVATIISSVAGIGASLLTGSLCKAIINYTGKCGVKALPLVLGKWGLESLVMCAVTKKFRDDMDPAVDCFNGAVDFLSNHKISNFFNPENV